jgi:elongation factor P--beta-lysine ligase
VLSEVETPLLCRAGVSDPALENFEVPSGQEDALFTDLP